MISTRSSNVLWEIGPRPWRISAPCICYDACPIWEPCGYEFRPCYHFHPWTNLNMSRMFVCSLRHNSQWDTSIYMLLFAFFCTRELAIIILSSQQSSKVCIFKYRAVYVAAVLWWDGIFYNRHAVIYVSEQPSNHQDYQSCRSFISRKLVQSH